MTYIFNENVTHSQVFFTHIASADPLTGFSMSRILAVEWLIDCNFRYVFLDHYIKWEDKQQRKHILDYIMSETAIQKCSKIFLYIN